MKFKVGQTVKIDLIDAFFEKGQSVYTRIEAILDLATKTQYYVSTPAVLTTYRHDSEPVDEPVHFSEIKETGETTLFTGFNVNVSEA